MPLINLITHSLTDKVIGYSKNFKSIFCKNLFLLAAICFISFINFKMIAPACNLQYHHIQMIWLSDKQFQMANLPIVP